MITSARHAWAFLTRLPGGAHPRDDTEYSRSLRWFGPVGLVVGGVVALAWVVLAWVFPSMTAAVLTVGFAAAITGALHEDGLADTVDGLAGGRTPERRLEIMRDSRLGVFGTVALVVVVLVDVSVLASFDVRTGATTVLTAHGLSRFAAARVTERVAPARADGLGAVAANRRMQLDVLTPVAVVVLHGVYAVIVLSAALVTTVVVVAWARRRIGGSTGDVAGAVARLVQTSTLLAVMAWWRLAELGVERGGLEWLVDLRPVAPWLPWSI